MFTTRHIAVFSPKGIIYLSFATLKDDAIETIDIPYDDPIPQSTTDEDPDDFGVGYM